MGIESAIVGGLVSGVGSLVGSAMTNDTNQGIASSNNATAIELANTAHQREVADLKAAGLNPILSATGGNGASVPTLTSPTITNALGDAMNAGITNYSALQTSRQMAAQVDKTRTEAKLNEALTIKAAADAASAQALTLKFISETDKTRSGVAGSTLGSDIGGFLANSARYFGSKLKDVISNVNVSSASKASASSYTPPPSSYDYNPHPHDGSLEHLLP